MKNIEEGDLFPRGSGPDATPRIKKRSGEVLFEPNSKRTRKTRELDPDEDVNTLKPKVTIFGSSLSSKRLTVGMNVLAMVVRSNSSIVQLALPSGHQAIAVDETLIDDEQLAKIQSALVQDTPMEEENSGEDSGSEGDDDEGEDDKKSEDDDMTKVQPLWKVLHVGQLLPVSVVSLPKDGEKEFSVSLKPHLVNAGLNPSLILTKSFPAYAAVMSIEDHGYILSFGSNISHTAFLPFNKCDQSGQNSRMRIGTPIQVLTEVSVSVPKKKRNASLAVRVRAQKDQVNRKFIDVLEAATFQDIRPGMLLRGRVMEEGPGGMSLLSLGVFEVAVDTAHIPCDADGNRLVEKDQQVSARVLFVDATSKLICASLLVSLVNDYKAPTTPRRWTPGSLLKPLRVETVRNGFGLSLRLATNDVDDKVMGEDDEDPETWKTVPIFAHISHTSDKKINLLKSKFNEGTVIQKGGRIITKSRLDGTVNVDLRESVLNRKALSIDEIEVGSSYDCRIVKHNEKGILVAIESDSKLRGFIPTLQVSDVSLTKEKLVKHLAFRISSTLKCIVLSVDKSSKNIILSARKSLVNPRYPLLTSLEDVDNKMNSKNQDNDDEENDGESGKSTSVVYTGNVARVKENGSLLVSFCNKISGLVPKNELALDTSKRGPLSIDEIQSMYPNGQTVAVRVVSVKPNEQILYLSMNLDTSHIKTRLKPGEFVNGRIVGINEDLNQFIVSVSERQTKSDKEMKEVINIECFLPFQHLSDVSGFGRQLATKLCTRFKDSQKSKDRKKEGKNSGDELAINSALVLAHSEGSVMLSMKECLKQGALNGDTPFSFNEVKEIAEVEDSNKSEHAKNKRILYGYVKSILPDGAVIGFMGNLVGLVQGRMVTDHFVNDLSDVFKIDQSIAAVVFHVDTEKSRFTLSTRPSDVGVKSIERFSLSTFGSYEQWSFLTMKSHVEKELSIGSIVNAKVTSIHEHGVEYSLETSKGLGTGVDRQKNVGKKTTGQTRVCILDVDPNTGEVDVTRDEKIIAKGTLNSSLEVGKMYEATVLLTKEEHSVLLVKVSKSKAAIGFAFVNPLSSVLDKVSAGASVECRALDMSTVKSKRNIVIIDTSKTVKESSQEEVSKRIISEQKQVQQDQISFLKNASKEDNINSIIGMKIKGRVSKLFPTHALISIGEGVVGHLHITNTFILKDRNPNDKDIGPIPSGIRKRFFLPPIGTVFRPLVTGIRRASTEDSSAMVVEMASTVTVPPKPELKVGGIVIGVVSTIKQKHKDQIKSDDNYIVYLSVNSSTAVVCHGVDCLPVGKKIGDNDKLKKVTVSEHLNNNLKCATIVKCLITSVPKNGAHACGALSANGQPISKDGDDGFFNGIVMKITAGVGLQIAIPWFARGEDEKGRLWGTLSICDLCDDFEQTEAMFKQLSIGNVIRVRRVKTSEDEKDIILTMRTKEQEYNKCKDSIINADNVGALKEGKKLRGFVKAVWKRGCFVTIGRNIIAYVLTKHLSDAFIDSPEKEFPPGLLVQGRILRTDVENKLNKSGENVSEIRTNMRLLNSGVKDTKLMDSALKKNSLKEGDVLKCIVYEVTDYGALVKLSRKVTALLHKYETGRRVKDTSKEWTFGQKLYVVVLKTGEKLYVGTKKYYFEEAGLSNEEVSEIVKKNYASFNEAKKRSKEMSKRISPNEFEEIGFYQKGAILENKSDDDVDMEDADDRSVKDEEEEQDTDENEEIEEPTKPLKVGRDFVFNAIKPNEDSADEKEESDDEEEELGEEATEKKRSSKEKREKKRRKEMEEAQIRLREEALTRNDKIPETAEDFERELVGQPNSSVLWIQYMAFCVGLSQVDKARAIAERALETIDVTKEEERLNVWVGYINLEARFGNMNAMDAESHDKSSNLKREAAVMRIFERGCERVTDVEGFYLQVAKALMMGDIPSADGDGENEKGDDNLARTILKKGTKKFKGNEKIWISYGASFFKKGDSKGGRECLERALRSVDKRGHGRLICKFAQFEYKYGSAERGRTVFESLVGNLPGKKGVDVWNIYLDMEINQCKLERKDNEGDEEEEQKEECVTRTRGLFERFVKMNLSSKKMKFGFKKWLEFERKFGTKEEQKSVKSRAREYVERIKMN